MAGRSFLVTGGTGFLGSAFVRLAVRSGARVTIIARAQADHWRLTDVAGGYDTLVASLSDLDGVPVMRGMDALVHFAAAGVNQAFDDVRQLVAVNVDGTLAALRFATRCGVGRFVHLGSSGEYGSGRAIEEGAPLAPTSEYGATRAGASLLARAYGQRRTLDVVVVRPFAVYGPFESAYRLVPHCILRGLRGQPLDISSGVQTRDYVYVDDVATGILEAAVQEGATNGTFNLCTGTETSVREAALLISRLVGGNAPVLAGTRPAVPGEMWRTTGSPAHSRAVLGWTATTDLEAGLRMSVEFFRTRGEALDAYRQVP